MAQASMTVRVDAQKKMRFDELCAEFGMSANTAVNVFINAVVQQCCIPFMISTSTGNDGYRAFRELRAMAKSEQLPDLTLEEINAEIRAARSERVSRLERV